MSRFAEHLLVQVLLLDLNLRCALDRLAVNEDPEALHDLRIALRSLRSVLRPLRGLPGVDVLSHVA
jgi:CHAD domain-containing protein